jgi:hypothetical protein
MVFALSLVKTLLPYSLPPEAAPAFIFIVRERSVNRFSVPRPGLLMIDF